MGEGNRTRSCEPFLSTQEAKEIITQMSFSGFYQEKHESIVTDTLLRRCNDQACKEKALQKTKSRCRTRTDTNETFDEDELCKSPVSSCSSFVETSNSEDSHGASLNTRPNESSKILKQESNRNAPGADEESTSTSKVDRQRSSYSPKGVRDLFTSDFCDESVSSSSSDESSFHMDIKRLIGDAQSLESEGNLDDALEVYNEALDLYDSQEREYSGALHCRIGILQWKRGCYEDSLAEFHAAIEYYQQRAEEEDEEELKAKAIIASDNEIAEAFIWASKVYLSQGEYKCCHQSLRNAQDFVPDPETSETPVLPSQVQIYSNALHVRGQLNEAKGHYRRALRHYEKALEYKREPHPSFTVREEKYNTDIASILLSIGSVSEKIGDYEKAVESFEQAFDVYCHAAAISNDSVAVDLGVALSNLGWVHFSMGNLERSLGLYNRALEYFQLLGENHRNLASVWVQMGMVYMKFPSPQHEEAFSSFQRALRVQRQVLGDTHEDIAITLSALAAAMGQMGHFEKALGFVGQVLRIRHDVFGRKHLLIGDTLVQMGRLYLAIGDKLSAIRCFEDAKAVYRNEVNHLGEDDQHLVSVKEYIEKSRVVIEIAQY